MTHVLSKGQDGVLRGGVNSALEKRRTRMYGRSGVIRPKLVLVGEDADAAAPVGKNVDVRERMHGRRE